MLYVFFWTHWDFSAVKWSSVCFCLDSSLGTSFPLQGLWLGFVFLPMIELLDTPAKFSLSFDDVMFWVVNQSPCRPLLPTYCLINRKWGTVYTDLFYSWDLLEKPILTQLCTLHLIWKLPPSVGHFSTSLARQMSVVSSWGKYEEKLMTNRQV